MIPAVLLAGLSTAAPVGAELYRWTDGQGVVHYTTDPTAIPESERARAEPLDAPQGRGEDLPPPSRATIVSFTAGRPILVTARINGTPVTLVLDTGADRTVVAPAALARAGIGTEAGATVRIVGVAGATTASEVSVPDLEVAGARLGPLTVVAHDPSVDGADGLIGRDVLDAFTVTIDVAGGRAILAPR